MTDKVNGISLTIVGLVFAAVGIVAPIAWDWWSSSSNITLTELQAASLVEKKADVKGLEVLYDGKVVENLSRILFRLENTGRIPIVESDLIEPPVVELATGVILNSAIESVKPSNLKAAVTSKSNIVQLNFQLLNPGDSITFSILTDAPTPKFVASARIKNISELKIVRMEEQISIVKDVGWTVYIVGVFAILFILTGLGLLLEIPKKNAQLKAVRAKETPVHRNEPVNVIKSYIKMDLGFLTGDRKKLVNNALPEDVEILDETQAKELASLIEKSIKEEDSFGPALILFGLAALGIWYVFNSVF